MSNIVYYILLVLTIVTNAGGGFMMKLGSETVSFGKGGSLIETATTMITNWKLILGIFSYGMSFVFATLVYTKISLNIAYPVSVCSSFLIITIASIIFLNERFTTVQGIGSLFLIIGIFMIASNLRNV